MKLKIDTVEKTIEVLENIQLEELVLTLNEMFNSEWDSYTLLATEKEVHNTITYYPGWTDTSTDGSGEVSFGSTFPENED